MVLGLRNRLAELSNAQKLFLARSIATNGLFQD